MELEEIISYIATGFLLISYCCRTVKLRLFQIFGGIANMIFAYMILDSSPSARSIIISNIIYLTINTIQLFREINLEIQERHERNKYRGAYNS
jgi:hypothetical protein